MTSAINPNNIDGAYPVAGQDNNSQGFRDNFTNIKVNFQEAAAEITDLQNKAVLKAALTGSTLDNNMNDVLLYAAKIQDFSASKVTVSATSGAIAVNYASGHYQSISTSGSISLSFTNFPANGSYGYIKLQINVTNTAHTVTISALTTLLGTAGIQGYSAISASSGTITFGTTGTYELAFGTYDGGDTITVFDLNRALTNFSTASFSVGSLSATSANVTGNVNAGNVISVGTVSGATVSSSDTISATGNVTGGNLTTTGAVAATGDVSGFTVSGFVRPTAGSASQAPLLFTAGTNTSVPAAGAVEYTGSVFLSTPSASQRGLLPTEYLVTLSTDYTATDSASAQKVFDVPANGAVTVLADTTYFVEGLYAIAPTANFNAESVQTLFALGGGATLTSIAYSADTSTGLAGAVNTVKRVQAAVATATTVTDAAPGGAATNFVIQIRGVIRTNTAGTITPQFQFTGTPGSAPVVQANSFFRLVPVGSGSVTTIGAWT